MCTETILSRRVMIETHAKFLEDNDGNNNINIDRVSSSSNTIFIVEESCTGRNPLSTKKVNTLKVRRWRK